MKSRDGMKSGSSPAFCRANCTAAAIAFPVQLPSSPWSYAGVLKTARKSLEGGSGVYVSGAAYMRSR